jgi:hypothetical protein
MKIYFLILFVLRFCYGLRDTIESQSLDDLANMLLRNGTMVNF